MRFETLLIWATRSCGLTLFGVSGTGGVAAEICRAAQRHFQREGSALDHAAGRRIEHIGVELVVVAVRIDRVLRDLGAGAGAVVDQAHGVALVDQLEGAALQRGVVVAGEDEEVVLGRQAVKRHDDWPCGLLPIEAMSRSAFLLRKIAPVIPFSQVQIGRDDRAVGVDEPQLRAAAPGSAWFRISDRVRLLKVGSAGEGGTLAM